MGSAVHILRDVMELSDDRGAMTDIVDVPGYHGPDRRAGNRADNAAEDARAPLVHEARGLLGRMVHFIGAARERTARGQGLVDGSRDRLVWSEAFLRDSSVDRDQLRAVVSKLARVERAQGVPPEKMLVLMKAILRNANTGTLAWDEARALTQDIILWSIEAYYAA
jgi:hypothetical protein